MVWVPCHWSPARGELMVTAGALLLAVMDINCWLPRRSATCVVPTIQGAATTNGKSGTGAIPAGGSTVRLKQYFPSTPAAPLNCRQWLPDGVEGVTGLLEKRRYPGSSVAPVASRRAVPPINRYSTELASGWGSFWRGSWLACFTIAAGAAGCSWFSNAV